MAADGRSHRPCFATPADHRKARLDCDCFKFHRLLSGRPNPPSLLTSQASFVGACNLKQTVGSATQPPSTMGTAHKVVSACLRVLEFVVA